MAVRRLTLPRVLGVGALLLVLIQVIRPSRTNPPVDQGRTIEALRNVPPEVSGILNRACKDCHSNTTVWPWYSNVAPASWVLINHVNEGRRHLSLSDWASYQPKQAAKKLGEMCEQVEKGEMPMSSYLWIHDEAVLTADDKQVVCGWAKKEQVALAQSVAP